MLILLFRLQHQKNHLQNKSHADHFVLSCVSTELQEIKNYLISGNTESSFFLQWNFTVDQLDICDLPHLRVPSTLLYEAHRHDQVSQGSGDQVSRHMWLLNGLVQQPVIVPCPP